jgi:hypothetical protein
VKAEAAQGAWEPSGAGGGAPGSGGAAGSGASSASGCGCVLGGRSPGGKMARLFLVGLGLLAGRRVPARTTAITSAPCGRRST